MKNSLKYKMILLYFLLVFIAMTVVGLFINREFENYNMKIVRQDMINISKNIINNMSILSQQSFTDNASFSLYKEELQRNIIDMPVSKTYEISIIDPQNHEILASTNSMYESQNAYDVFESSVLLATQSQDMVEKDILVNPTENAYRIKNMAFVNKSQDGEIKYIVYQRRSLDDIDAMLNNVTFIIIRATFVALVITIILGYFVSNSITIPIKNLTKTALIVSKGDFSKKVKVSSNDEIGQLGRTFNYLTKSLEDMIKELSSEKSKLNAIIYHMKNGLVAIDTFGRIIHYNLNFEEMIYDKKYEGSLINKKYDDVIGLCTSELSFSKIIRNYSNNVTKEITFKIRDKYFKASTAVFKADNGALEGIIVVMQDITEAQRLEDLRKDFVANVSHELKTPITSIKSYTETLLDGAIEDKNISTQFLHVINSESDRMNHIIKDLLQLSHMDYKKENWDMKEVDVNKIVKECIEKMEIHAKGKNQILTHDIAKKKMVAVLDKNKIEQVIINLISNAIKYTNAGGLIHLSTELVDKYCEIHVKDQGIGIPKKDLPFIFDRFYRVDKGRSRALGGTGLGLSICKSIISEHKGEILVKSVEGKGSEFIVKLPVDKL